MERGGITLDPAHREEEIRLVHGQVPAFPSNRAIGADIGEGVYREVCWAGGQRPRAVVVRTNCRSPEAPSGDEISDSDRKEEEQTRENVHARDEDGAKMRLRTWLPSFISQCGAVPDNEYVGKVYSKND